MKKLIALSMLMAWIGLLAFGCGSSSSPGSSPSNPCEELQEIHRAVAEEYCVQYPNCCLCECLKQRLEADFSQETCVCMEPPECIGGEKVMAEYFLDLPEQEMIDQIEGAIDIFCAEE